MSAAGRLTDLFATLGVAARCTADELKAGYRLAAMAAHPDTGGSHEQFLVVGLAYEVLNDPQLRRLYESCHELDHLLAIGLASVDITVVERLVSSISRDVMLSSFPLELRLEVSELLARAARSLSGWNQGDPNGPDDEDESDDDVDWDDVSGDPDSQDEYDDWDDYGDDDSDHDIRDEYGVPGSQTWEEATSEWRATWRDVVRSQLDFAAATMDGWPSLRQNLLEERDTRAGRRLLHRAYLSYCTLRMIDDHARSDQYFGDPPDEVWAAAARALAMLPDIVSSIRSVGERVERSYNVKTVSYFRRRLDEVTREMARRGQSPPRPARAPRRSEPRPASPVACRECARPVLWTLAVCAAHATDAEFEQARLAAGDLRCCSTTLSGGPCRALPVPYMGVCSRHGGNTDVVARRAEYSQRAAAEREEESKRAAGVDAPSGRGRTVVGSMGVALGAVLVISGHPWGLVLVPLAALLWMS